MASIQLHCFDNEKMIFVTFVTFNLLRHKFSIPASEPLVNSKLTLLIHNSNHLKATVATTNYRITQPEVGLEYSIPTMGIMGLEIGFWQNAIANFCQCDFAV